MLVDKKGIIMNILKGIGIICGATGTLVMGIWSACYVMLENDMYEARHGDEEALKRIERHGAYIDKLAEAKTCREIVKIAKEYILDI